MVDTFEVRVAVDDMTAVRAVRRAVSDVVAQWSVRPALVDEACLVVSELVTNALVHGRSDALLRLTHDGPCLRIEVADEDTRLPVVAAPDPLSLSGRGLLLIASLVATWGAERTADGKVVWAEFDVSDRRDHRA